MTIYPPDSLEHYTTPSATTKVQLKNTYSLDICFCRSRTRTVCTSDRSSSRSRRWTGWFWSRRCRTAQNIVKWAPDGRAAVWRSRRCDPGSVWVRDRTSCRCACMWTLWCLGWISENCICCICLGRRRSYRIAPGCRRDLRFLGQEINWLEIS